MSDDRLEQIRDHHWNDHPESCDIAYLLNCLDRQQAVVEAAQRFREFRQRADSTGWIQTLAALDNALAALTQGEPDE